METLDVVKCCAPFFPRGAASDSSTFPSLCWTTQAQSTTTSPGRKNCDSPSKCETMKLRNKQPTTLECCWENTLFRSRLRWYLLIRWCSPAQPKLGSVNKQTGCLIKCKRIFGSQLSQKERPFLIWQNRYIPNQGDEANDFSGLFSTASETFVNGRKARHVELGLVFRNHSLFLLLLFCLFPFTKRSIWLCVLFLEM